MRKLMTYYLRTSRRYCHNSILRLETAKDITRPGYTENMR